MFDWWINFAVTILIGVLQQTIKNPKSQKIEESVLIHIRDIAAEAVLAVDPNAPAPPGYEPIGGITQALPEPLPAPAAAPEPAPAPAPAAPVVNKTAQTL